MSLDTLRARERHVTLFERYGALLTDHQQDVLRVHLDADLSLAELAQQLGVSRAAVHEVVRRSLQLLEEHESRLHLLAEEAVRRRETQGLLGEVASVRRRLEKLEARLLEFGSAPS